MEIDTVKVLLVPGDRVRDINVDFALGGHHYVYDFIPEDEIWIENSVSDRDDMGEIIVHEQIERTAMKFMGFDYDKAHNLASAAETLLRKADREQLPMDKTASQIAVTVLAGLQKRADVFYRGMGMPFVSNVLEQGLPRSRSVTSSLDIAKEYAGKGAYNILQGDITQIPEENIPLRTQHAIEELRRIGLEDRAAHYYAPLNLSPKGAVIAFDVAPEKIPEFLGQKGLPHLQERITTKSIPASAISIAENNLPIPGEGKWLFPSVARRLTQEQMRLIHAVNKVGKGKDVTAIINRLSSKQPYHLDFVDRLRAVRTNRKLLTKALKGLLQIKTANQIAEHVLKVFQPK